MNKETTALKLALEALEGHTSILGLKDREIDSKAITAIREALADSALDRMAENARELGLDYEPPCKTGSQCTSKCQQCEQPAQEPVAWPCVIAEADFEKDTITLEMQCSDYMIRAGQHWLSTSPPAAQQQEPFGYFKPEPFGWTDCAETDEGAIGLYERPQPAQQQEPSK